MKVYFVRNKKTKLCACSTYYDLPMEEVRPLRSHSAAKGRKTKRNKEEECDDYEVVIFKLVEVK